MKLVPINPFEGQHCETTATGTLLKQIGIELSEPMLFGLGEGLGYIYWKIKSMDFPFIGGRIKPDLLTQNIAKNLNLQLKVRETASAQKSWEHVRTLIDKGHVVGLKLDCFHLQYFSHAFHFAGHYVAIYGYDDESAYLVDTRQQGGLVKTSLESLASARAEKGPMSSKNLYYILNKKDNNLDLRTAIITAMRNNAIDYLQPPIKNIGYKGILKTSTELIKWFKTSKNIGEEFKTAAMLMENAGTGGALFRNLYRDFLAESYSLIKIKELKTGQSIFAEVADHWSEVAYLFTQVSKTQDFQYIQQASDLLKVITSKEKRAMEILTGVH